MKKTPKRLLSLLLGATLSLLAVGASALTAQAAPQGGADIIVNAPSGQTLAGQTINLYKVFDATWDEADAYTYTLSTGFATPTTPSFVDAIDTALSPTTPFASVDDIVAFLTSTTEPPDAATMSAFAKAVMDFAATNSIATTASAVGAGASVTFDGLDLGYYLVTGGIPDTTTTGNAAITSAAVLLTNDDINAPVNVDLKLGLPDVDKSVTDGTDAQAKATNANIGDTVQFTLTSTVPVMTSWTKYTFIMHDTLDKGLTINTDFTSNANSFVVTIDGTPLTYGTDYTVALEATQPSSGTAFSITFNDFIDHVSQAGKAIEVTYNATLNENALVSSPTDMEPNDNTVYLEYSNSPYTTSTNRSIDHKAKVYTFGFNIFKFTGTNTPLADAQFQLLKTEGDPASAVNFTTPATAGDPYVVTKAAAGASGTTTTLVSAADGTIAVKGLVAGGSQLTPGKYYLVETAAPSGYNLLEAPIIVTISPAGDITASHTQDLTDVGISYSWDTPACVAGTGTNCDLGTGNQLGVKNVSGGRLPSTGGMGTTIFTVAGLIIMLAAAGVLIVRRRTNRQTAA